MIPFAGAAVALVAADYVDAAKLMGVEPAVIRAVTLVETGTGGGFLGDGSGRPNILFEAHLFGAATGHVWDNSYPDISTLEHNWHLYRAGAAEYVRLNEAVALDYEAAIRSASWGLFQILGSNCRDCGYPDATMFVAAMAASERKQLGAFTAFCDSIQVTRALRAHDWPTFAMRYNGPAYEENDYANKLAEAYARCSLAPGAADGFAPASPPPPLRLGASGPLVRILQVALDAVAHSGLVVDGAFGRGTDYALRRFQERHGLGVDGIAGRQSLTALGIPLTATLT